MNNLICYKTLEEWNANTLPKAFQRKHNTKVDTWAKLTIVKGKLKYYALDENENILGTFIFDSDSDTPFIEPQAWHKVEAASDDLRCQLSFYCQPKHYYQKKYSMSAVHSEVMEVTQHICSGKALDLGCGGGRNALYLQSLGFDVSAFDRNPHSIETLNHVITSERLADISAYVANAHDNNLSDAFDLIISTVVFMFLDRDKIPQIIKNMQACTTLGGYNLIVCAMDSDDYPMADHQLPFNFGFKTGELKAYYNDWEIIKYNEEVGHLHRKDANGNPIALRFATLIARNSPYPQSTHTT